MNANAGIAFAAHFGAEPHRKLDRLYGPKTIDEIKRFCGIKRAERG